MNGPLILGEAFGFSALGFTGASAMIMAFRAKLVRTVGGADRLRSIHVAVSLLAALSIAGHVYVLFLPPDAVPVDLGYAAVALGLALWMTGVGFLERNRDSFFLHGGLAVALVCLVTAHAAASGTDFPLLASLAALGSASVAALANAAYHARKLLRAPRRK